MQITDGIGPLLHIVVVVARRTLGGRTDPMSDQRDEYEMSSAALAKQGGGLQLIADDVSAGEAKLNDD